VIDARFKPLGAWPRKETPSRRRAPFKSAYNATLDLLERELRHLGAQQIEIQIDLDRSKIRNDGWPASNARPTSPKVILSFIASRQPGAPVRVFPCDRFAYWEDNLRAIALSLEALRKVDRYGVTTSGEQYAGFKQIASTSTTTINAEQASAILSEITGHHRSNILSSPDMAKDAIRRAIAFTHPDRNAGDRTAYDRVDAARSVLSSHHGVSL
jgi:hypothetical protein